MERSGPRILLRALLAFAVPAHAETLGVAADGSISKVNDADPSSFMQVVSMAASQLTAAPCPGFCSDGESEMAKDKDGGQEAWIRELMMTNTALSKVWTHFHKAAKAQLEDARAWDEKIKKILKPQVDEQ